jgi:hypothetical protein
VEELMNKEWIEQNIGYLEQKLIGNIIYEFEPTEDFYTRVFQFSEFGSVLYQLCSHAGLSTVPEIEVVGDSDIPVLDLQSGSRYFEKVIDSAGDIHSTSPLSAKIRIGIHQLYHVRNVGRILGHEVAHHFLKSRIIRPVKEDENEMFTDLAAIHIGFGKLIINGAIDETPDSVVKPIHLSKQGTPYLGYPLLTYAYYLCQIKRGVPNPALYESVNGPCVTFIKSFDFYKDRKLTIWTRFLAMVSSIPKLPDTDGTKILQEAWRLNEQRYRIVKCVGCGASLKIPKKETMLSVTCPKCKKEFKVGVRYR